MADNSILESNSKALPKDLVITSQPDSVDKDKFNVVATGLKIDSTYAFQFQYVFPDGEVSEWSPGYIVSTSTEAVPAAPSASIPSTSVGSIPVTLSSFPANAKRVDIYIIGGEFGTGKVADYFLAAGTKSIAVAGGVYQVSLITVTPSGINGDPTNTFTITVSTAGETVEAPTNPNGFSIIRVLGGIEVVWAGTYANGTFTGFEAIKIYVGNSATATAGTFVEAGVMTGNNVRNSIIIPVDGTYLRYDQPVYIHARAVNRDGDEGTLQVNVANNALGARSAVSSDLANEIITNEKLVNDAVTAAKIATNAVTETKIAADAVTSEKIIANAITSDKIVSSAIIADKIATNAITATKIKAGEIDVTKLAAGTISVNNLEAGTISSTSFIRAGSTTGGARIEISSAAISGGPAAGFYIYNSSGTAILSAPLTGGLSVVGDITGSTGTFSGALSIGSNFSVTSTGILSAAAGSIGGWTINSTQLRSSAADGANRSYISLNPSTPKIALITGATFSGGIPSGGTEAITIDPVEGITGPSVTVQGSTGPGFKLSPNGTATLRGNIFASSGNIGGWTLGTSTLTGGGVTLNSSGSISSSVFDSFYNSTNTTTITGGNISLTSTGTTYLSNNSISISGRNLNNAATTMSLSGQSISFSDNISTGIIQMLDGQLNIGGAGTNYTVNIGGFGTVANLNVGGRLSVLGGLNTTTGTAVVTGSTESEPRIRNISAGTTAKTSGATDGIRGDIYIQFSA